MATIRGITFSDFKVLSKIGVIDRLETLPNVTEMGCRLRESKRYNGSKNFPVFRDPNHVKTSRLVVVKMKNMDKRLINPKEK